MIIIRARGNLHHMTYFVCARTARDAYSTSGLGPGQMPDHGSGSDNGRAALAAIHLSNGRNLGLSSVVLVCVLTRTSGASGLFSFHGRNHSLETSESSSIRWNSEIKYL